MKTVQPEMAGTIAAHCADNTLIIPEGLADFRDAACVMQFGGQAIYHKLIRGNMRGIEFYTNAPCLCYPVRGTETFYTGCGNELVIEPGSFLMMPRDSFMVSDFENRDGPLEAFLFFFNDRCIAEFLRTGPLEPLDANPMQDAYRIPSHPRLSAYISALHDVYSGMKGSAALLQTKLVELLLLIAESDEPKRLRSFLRTSHLQGGKRNIRHLMKKHAAQNLSVADYARLSGRSISTFNREFRRNFGIAPSKWLIARKLERAHDALLATNAPVTEIGLDIGYANTSHFIKQFKCHFGRTPSQVRTAEI